MRLFEPAKSFSRVAVSGGDFSEQWGDDMASAEREPIPGVQGQRPWSEGQGASPPLKLKEN